MREPPPAPLIALLERLGLAAAGDLHRVARRVGRLARDLPQFESAWIDALAQARVLTPFQAAQLNAGRGESLRIGPYLLCGSLGRPGYAAWYRARRADSRRIVRLVVAENAGERAEEILGRLEALAAASPELECEQLAPISEAGADGARIWAASPWVEGRTAAQWLVHNGRLPPEVVLEIARAMLAGLVTLEKAGLCHGDVSTASLMLTDSGGVVFLDPGLRAILRPEEGYAHADLPPEAYDYLAPERVTDGTPPTIAGDVYACGCLWWQMLCGRPPLSGGDSLGKLRAAQAAKIPDVRRLAPEVPGELGAAVAACLGREPTRRPESMQRLAAMLGPPTPAGKRALARCLAGPAQFPGRWAGSTPASGWFSRGPSWMAATAGCLLAVVAIVWLIWRFGLAWPGAQQEPIAKAAAHDSPAREDGGADLPESPAEPGASEPGYGGRVTEGGVVAAHYEAGQSPSGTPPTAPQDLVLASGGPLRSESLRLRAGQCVRGRPGKRPLVMVPPTGLVVDVEGVRFENVDFVWDHPAQAEEAALVHVRSARAEFRGCQFRPTRRLPTPPVAIRWTHPADSDKSEFSLPSGRVRLRDCVLRWVGVGVECQTRGALAVELANTLQLGGGPLVRLDHCPRPDEPVLIALERVTLRGGGPVLECSCRAMDEQPGEISIQAAGCAFVPEPNGALLLLTGPESPQRILGSIRWTGQGSLVSPEAVIAAWRLPDGGQRVLDEAAVSIDGLVRSRVEFAGSADSGAAASRIIRWQVPLRSTDPPGIDAAALPQGDAAADRP
jgi:serine/threonine-protein kinase